ncbi:MAG: biotin--[acetyl-CoA-carboxylase] ligase, partial [Pseudomonadota bacterium]|nr:biotin--[acetyl-CoA-carboxylase] ligase [Pseudomonadota bacterium]
MIRTVPETGSTNADLLSALRAGEAVREGDWL